MPQDWHEVSKTLTVECDKCGDTVRACGDTMVEAWEYLEGLGCVAHYCTAQGLFLYYCMDCEG